MAQLKRLDEQFSFDTTTPILDTLQRLLKAIELRLQSVDELRPVLEDTINNLTTLALDRMNETFTPLILDAQERLEEFGANFAAHSVTELTVGTGTQILSLDEADRAGYVYADYVALRNAASGAFMIGQVTAYDREAGQLTVSVEVTSGTGTYSDWDITISVQPNLAHETDYDNPHNVTAAQVGAYTTSQVDSALLALQTALYAYIANFELANVLRTSGNLAGLTDLATARINIGLGSNATGKANLRTNIGVGSSGDTIPTLAAANTWTKPQAVVRQALSSGVAADMSAHAAFLVDVNGSTFNIVNPSAYPTDQSAVVLFIDFTTADTVTFGDKYAVDGYLPTSIAGVRDVLLFWYDSSAGEMQLLGFRNGINQ